MDQVDSSLNLQSVDDDERNSGHEIEGKGILSRLKTANFGPACKILIVKICGIFYTKKLHVEKKVYTSLMTGNL